MIPGREILTQKILELEETLLLYKLQNNRQRHLLNMLNKDFNEYRIKTREKNQTSFVACANCRLNAKERKCSEELDLNLESIEERAPAKVPVLNFSQRLKKTNIYDDSTFIKNEEKDTNINLITLTATTEPNEEKALIRIITSPKGIERGERNFSFQKTNLNLTGTGFKNYLLEIYLSFTTKTKNLIDISLSKDASNYLFTNLN